MSKRRLGKGIDALLQGRPLDELSNLSSIIMVDLDRIAANPDQPRKRFNQETLAELAASIREKGIIQPIIAEDRGDGTYTIIAGERRYRAAKLAGLAEVPVISQELSDEEKLEIALIENMQREDLNPMDEAHALQSALDHTGITQDQLAKRLGKSRPAIANSLRLLKLEPEIQRALLEGELTAGHARALLAVTDAGKRTELFERIRSDGLSVREAELAVKGRVAGGAAQDDGRGGADGSGTSITLDDETLSVPEGRFAGGASGGTAHGDRAGAPGDADADAAPQKSVELQRIEDHLVRHLGTRVVIRGTDEKGRIEISYLSTDDLERILESMGTSAPD